LQTAGSAGLAGQVLVSAGPGATPSWTSALGAPVTIPFSQITTGTDLGQTLTLGAGSNLTTAGTGFISGAITGAVINNSTIGFTTPSTGAFTTLTSSGNSTLGTGALAITNSFGTTGNAAAASNTIGSQFAGSSNTINGRSIFDGTGQTAANLVTVQNLPNAA